MAEEDLSTSISRSTQTALKVIDLRNVLKCILVLRLNGKTAVITGGATGIGRAAAKRFIEEGALRSTRLWPTSGPNARAAKGSVSDQADLDRLYAAVKAERGTLDIVFANAGAGSQLSLGVVTVENCDEILDTNVKGSIFTVQKALPLMGQGGSIILTGSSAGTTGAPAFSLYGASKAAGTGIRVNVLSPGPTATELANEALGEEGMKVFASLNPLQRMADPAEIGAVAAFLASQDSSFMTASEVAASRKSDALRVALGRSWQAWAGARRQRTSSLNYCGGAARPFDDRGRSGTQLGTTGDMLCTYARLR
ncbi:hypothetical protein V1523DRAFT_446534 [Lipomyces doorenjongii]